MNQNNTVLNSSEVKKYFFEILDSGLSNEEKFNKFVVFFEQFIELESKVKTQMLSYGSQLTTKDKDGIDRLSSDIGQKIDMKLEYFNQIMTDNKIDSILSDVGQKMGIWMPAKILQQTEDSIKRAIRRLKNSQHDDGGWGFNFQKSDFWGTAYAVLCLNSAQKLGENTFDVDFDLMLRRGIKWIEDNPIHWSVERIAPQGNMPIYQISLAIRCFPRVGEEQFSKESSLAISQCVKKLINSQNEDGGWDAQIWGTEFPTPTRVWSDVGATSFVLQALAETEINNNRKTIENGIRWLIDNQNKDGSWDDGFSGKPSINKTCDALQGILIEKNNIKEFKSNIDKAVEWLQSMEKPIFDENRNMKGWGWEDYSVAYFENTCLTLETLVKLPDSSLPLLTANAQWLIENQYKKDDDIEDGNWKGGHTARIALSLIEYYRKIKESPLFGIQK